MMKFIVSYHTPYTHHVMVGVSAASQEEALAKCQKAFDEGVIWDDTLEMPLLLDDFVDEGATLHWDVQAVEAFPEADASILELKRRESAFAACRMLAAAYRSGGQAGGSVAWEDLDAAHSRALQALRQGGGR